MDTPEKHTHFQFLKRALQALTAAPSPQPALFPEAVATPDELALDYDNWASVVRGNYEHDLSELQRRSLAAIDRRFSELSDGSLEMWTGDALAHDAAWADVRRLGAEALEAFGWTVEGPEIVNSLDPLPAEPLK